MKYQGFYDYSLDNTGNPDRTYTAKQFCMYLKGLLGNGIGITNATGDSAWKVEKTGDLTAKVILANNGYNFASLDGNPFIVDEELNLIFSQGTDRWDSVIIRANSSMEVRATEVIIQEGNINYIRNTDIYDLRIARVHIVNDVITEIIDDRTNNEFCGIADGLVTVPTSELEKLLEDIKSGNLVALKDGTLQTGLNSEMVGGKTFDDISNIITDSIKLGTYTGTSNGTSTYGGGNKTLEIGFKPRFVIIIGGKYLALDFSETNKRTVYNFGSSSTSVNNFDVTFNETSTSVSITGTNCQHYAMNALNVVYTYVAFK